MTFPLYGFDVFGHATGLVLGVLLGMAFGFVLERAGFGRASILAAQFYFHDNRVFKVMFSGIATTTVLLGLLSGLGVVELEMLTVPETFVGPQIVGGLLLGAGFVVAGYCPGTGIVAAASGRIDGLLTYVGVMAGSLVFGFFYPQLEGFYMSGGMGAVRLDQVFGLPFPVVSLAVAAMAIGCFFAVERLEAWMATRRGTPAPDVAPPVRNVSLGGIASVAAIGLVPAFLGGAAAVTPAGVTPDPIDALTLAGGLVEDPTDYWIVDVRAPADCAAARVPGALCLPADDPDAKFVADLPTSRTLVVVGGATPGPLPDAVAHWSGRVARLDGGYDAFRAAVLTAPTLPAEPTPAQIADFRVRSALHGHYTGSAAAAPVVVAAPRRAATAAKKGGGC